MPLGPGTRLGPDEVKLERDALKTLPGSFASDPDRPMRFARGAFQVADVAPDGRFIARPRETMRIRVVEHWFEALRARPGGGPHSMSPVQPRPGSAQARTDAR